MRTPAGKDCKHYYEDYYRGREVQECRLIKANPKSLSWKPVDCSICPVPAILNANASPNMELTLRVDTRLFGLGRKITVEASCMKHHIPIENAYTGCPKCASEKSDALDLFRQALEGDDD